MLRCVCVALAFTAASGCSEPTGPPSVLLVVVDTLRADFLSASRHPRDTSPNLSHLAESGVSFRSCVAASPWTGPSVASILTGHYPDEVGIRGLTNPLPSEAETLAERLSAAGLATGAVVSNAIAGRRYGYAAGYDDFYFERYKEGALDMGGNAPKRPSFTANRVTDRALEWLKEATVPFLLHVHYTDPHDPYLPPEEWRERFVGPQPLREEALLGTRFTKLRLRPVQVEALRRSYEAEIAFVDAEIGRLLAALPANTLVVLVADHGEEFLDHGGYLHGQTLFEELLHVPLILQGPGIPAGVVVETPVSQVDVTPTILDLLGLPTNGLTGRSLRPLFEAGSPPGEPRVILSMRENRTTRCVSARLERWKLARCGGTNPTLYDLLEDPLEQRNVASQHEKVVAHLMAQLDRHERELRSLDAEHDPEGEVLRLRELRAIGYIA